MERFELILLEIAKKDLEASKLLFSNGLYPHAVFYLQQAIEKAVKSFGIWYKIINEDEAKKYIGHKTWKLYYKIFDEVLKMIPILEDYLNKLPELRNVRLIKEFNLSQLKSILQDYEKQKEKYIKKASNLSYEELLNIINELNESRSLTILSNLKEKLNEVLDTTLAKYRSAIDVKAIKEKLESITTEDLLKLLFCLLSLFILSLIFSHHAVKSRYPENNSNPLQVYTNEMPLIQTFKHFIELTEEVLKALECLLTNHPSGFCL